MARYKALSKLPASKIIEKAAEHFGTLSGGLSTKSKTESSLCLESPDGYVTISICSNEGKGKKSEVDIETSQFDIQVREFLALI